MTKEHCGYLFLPKSIVEEGSYVQERISFPDATAAAQMDNSFRKQADYYHGVSINLIAPGFH